MQSRRRGGHFGARVGGARRWAAITVVAVVLGGASAGASASAPGSRDDGGGNAQVGFHTHIGGDGEEDVNVCSDAVPAGQAHCLAHRRIDAAAQTHAPARPGASPAAPAAARPGPAATIGNAGAYDPPYLQSAYNTHTLSATAGANQTVAIVDAYDDPSAVANLMSYRSFFGLPGCAGGSCLTKVDENGGTHYPSADSGWSEEISLDLDMVSAMCPNCKILLVEASTAAIPDLGTAVNTAVRLGANVVSNSYGAGEYGSEVSDSGQYYDHPGVAVVASSGDSGYGVEFPAAANTVTAVGGTSLVQTTNTGTRSATETVWSGAGSGCSAYEAKPAWQTDTGCAKRTVADVSAVADPYTGVWVYDTYGTGGTWLIFGGTSVASPIIGSLYALAGNAASANELAQYPYLDTAALNDVSQGSNGSCGSSYLCTGRPGYDGPTGWGTPNGAAAFTAPTQAPSTPLPPANLTATAGNGSVSLAWSASSGSSITYSVFRGTASGQESTTASASSLTATGWTDPAASNGTTYYYEVKATNSAGPSGPSNEAFATPQAPSKPNPPALGATAGNASVSLSWTATAGASGTYSVYRGPAGAETLLQSGLPTTTLTDTTVTNGTAYSYFVTATNAGGTSNNSNEVTVTPQAAAGVPAQPVLSATRSTTRGIVLSWSAPANNGSPIMSYVLYRSRTSGQESTYVTVTCSASSCGFTDTNTRSGRNYYYQLAAVNGVGTGPRSAQASATAA